MIMTNLNEFYRSLEDSGTIDEKTRKEIKDFARQLNYINFIYQAYFPSLELFMKSGREMLKGNTINSEEMMRHFQINNVAFARSRAKHDFTTDVTEIAYHSVMQELCFPGEKTNPIDKVISVTEDGNAMITAKKHSRNPLYAQLDVMDRGYSVLIDTGRIGSQCIGQDSRTVNKIKGINPESEKYLEQIIASYQKRSDNLNEVCTMRQKDKIFSELIDVSAEKGIVDISPKYGFDIFDYLKIQSEINALRAGMIQYKINELKQKNIDPNWNIFLGKY